MFCGDLNGKEIQGKGDVSTRAPDSLFCTGEIINNTTL